MVKNKRILAKEIEPARKLTRYMWVAQELLARAVVDEDVELHSVQIVAPLTQSQLGSEQRLLVGQPVDFMARQTSSIGKLPGDQHFHEPGIARHHNCSGPTWLTTTAYTCDTCMRKR
ncbi:hypothetical protein ON010_g1199 [Phytophthora cinnamomi]|nr:hypothetical protein ON010_g1199 [Phytophthora cinnamomi]